MIKGSKKKKIQSFEKNALLVFRVSKHSMGTWKVVKFMGSHNHVFLNPKKIQFLKSHRQVTITQRRRLIDTFGEANINTSQLMSA